jgi:hypothetical protein
MGSGIISDYSGFVGNGNTVFATGYWTPSTSPSTPWVIQDNTHSQLEPTHHSFMSTITSDIKGFISQHRNVIYSVVLILLVDHFFLGGKLKERVKGMVEKLLGTVEKKVSDITHTSPAAPVVVTPTP